MTESLTVDVKTGLSGLQPGVYYLRVGSYDTNLFGLGSDYRLRIYVPIAPSGGVPFPPPSGVGNIVGLAYFYIFLEPEAAVSSGAGWRVEESNNTTYYSDADTYWIPLTGSPTSYTLEFNSIPGFVTPTNLPIELSVNETLGIITYYLSTNLFPRGQSPIITTNGTLKFTFTTNPGSRHALEESTNLFDWLPIVTNEVPVDGLLHFTRTNLPSNAKAFYRTRWVP